jgi:hypothetical protein
MLPKTSSEPVWEHWDTPKPSKHKMYTEVVPAFFGDRFEGKEGGLRNAHLLAVLPRIRRQDTFLYLAAYDSVKISKLNSKLKNIQRLMS